MISVGDSIKVTGHEWIVAGIFLGGTNQEDVAELKRPLIPLIIRASAYGSPVDHIFIPLQLLEAFMSLKRETEFLE